MKESDWKKFKIIKEKAIDKFCIIVLAECTKLINDKNISAYDRYGQLYRLLEEKDNNLAIIFDGHSRSKASMQLMHIRAEGLADEEDLEQLTKECFDHTNPRNFD